MQGSLKPVAECFQTAVASCSFVLDHVYDAFQHRGPCCRLRIESIHVLRAGNFH